MPPQNNQQQFKELKDLLMQMNEKILGLEMKITDNHKELLERINRVEEKSSEALVLAQKNEAEIFSLVEKQDSLKQEIRSEILETVKSEVKLDYINK